MFIFLDTETTGTDEDDRLCQIAFKTEAGLTMNELFNPGKSIWLIRLNIILGFDHCTKKNLIVCNFLDMLG